MPHCALPVKLIYSVPLKVSLAKVWYMMLDYCEIIGRYDVSLRLSPQPSPAHLQMGSEKAALR